MKFNSLKFGKGRSFVGETGYFSAWAVLGKSAQLFTPMSKSGEIGL
jgi:hypothetical protein